MAVTAIRNKVKPDTVLKNFWRDNQRFADVFNTVLFNGKQVLKPEDLKEADTDISSVIKFNNHAETVQRILDVVRKTADGTDFIIWGLENQEKIHYAMPLRHMIANALIYLKEYNELSARNKREKNYSSSGEFLSGLTKTDRLHPIIGLCIYYGEEEWDGPTNLVDMIQVTEDLKPMVSDYKMNLLQIRSCEHFQFQNNDVQTVFDMVRLIYEEDYTNFNKRYKDKSISTELGLTIGSIVNSQRIINQSLTMEERESEIDMCKALENLVNNSKLEEKKETVLRLSDMGMPIEQIAQAVKIAVEDVQSWLQESSQQ
mgnify:FL=1